MDDLEDYIRRNQELLATVFSREDYVKALDVALENLNAALSDQSSRPRNEKLLKNAIAVYTLYALLHRTFGKSEAANPTLEQSDTGERLFKCSFCGNSYANSDIVAGPDVYICRKCTEIVSSIFSEKQP